MHEAERKANKNPCSDDKMKHHWRSKRYSRQVTYNKSTKAD